MHMRWKISTVSFLQLLIAYVNFFSFDDLDIAVRVFYHRLLKGMSGGGSPPPVGFGAIGGGVGALRVGAGRVGISGGAVNERERQFNNNGYIRYKVV